jgi:hypothetical protein
MHRKLILIVCITSLCAVPGSAQVIRYTMTNINFSTTPVYANGGYVANSSSSDSSAVGTFDYNTVSRSISNISITTTNIPGTLYCYEIDTTTCPQTPPNPQNPPGVVLNYSGSNYTSSISSGGATAEVIPDAANGNNQQIIFFSNANGGGSVTAPGGGEGGGKCNGGICCNTFYNGGCILSLTIPYNALGSLNIQLTSDSLGGAQSAPGSGDPLGNPVCASESYAAGENTSFVRYSFKPCGSLTGVIQAGGGLNAFGVFVILAAAYGAARVLRRSSPRSV